MLDVGSIAFAEGVSKIRIMALADGLEPIDDYAADEMFEDQKIT